MNKRLRVKKRFHLNDDDDEEWDDDFEEDDGSPEDLEVDGPSFAPMFTGILDHTGEPILRHPVVIRMGFYRDDEKYHTPTLDAGPYPGSGSIVGWVYRSG